MNRDFPALIETWLLAPVAAPDFSLSRLEWSGPHSGCASRQDCALLNFGSAVGDCAEQDLKAFNRLHARWAAQGLQLARWNLDRRCRRGKSYEQLARTSFLSFPICSGSDDVAGIYNILYRYLFDRHRDLSLPTSFLINEWRGDRQGLSGTRESEHVEQDFRHIPADRRGKTGESPAVSWHQRNFGISSQLSQLRFGFLSAGISGAGRSVFSTWLCATIPTSAEALYGLGSVYLKQEKTARGAGKLRARDQTSGQLSGHLANAWNNLGLLATREGHTAEAIPYFQEALKLNPDHLIALDNLGNAYRQQKSWDEARKLLERAVAVGPQDAEANYSLGMVLCAAQRQRPGLRLSAAGVEVSSRISRSA